MGGIFDSIMMETYDRNLYLSDVYSPFYIASYAMHRFNLRNRDAPNHVLWQAKVVPNMRLHLLMVAPPGFMKTHYLSSFAGDDYSIFTNTATPIVHRQNINEASFIGTFRQNQRDTERKEGIAEKYKDGIVAIDEFDAINNAMKSSYNNQFETQLLAALDHGDMYKDMAGGNLKYKTYLTMWSGIQPTRFDMSAGLGRRFCYMLFVPTKEDNDNLRNIIHESYNMRAGIQDLKNLHTEIKEFNANIDKIQKVYIDDTLNEFYAKEGLFCHESTNFNKIAIGYNLAKYGPEKELVVGLHDDTLRNMLLKEKEWRDNIQQGIDFKMIVMMLERHGGIMDLQQIISECMMYGWNASIVGALIKDLSDNGYVTRKRKTIELQL